MLIDEKPNKITKPDSKFFLRNAKDILGYSCGTFGLVLGLAGLYEFALGGKILPLLIDLHLNSIDIFISPTKHLDHLTAVAKCSSSVILMQLGKNLIIHPQPKSNCKKKEHKKN